MNRWTWTIATLVVDELRAHRFRSAVLTGGVAAAMVVFLLALALGSSNGQGLSDTVRSAHGLAHTYRVDGLAPTPDAVEVAAPALVAAYLDRGLDAVTLLPLEGLPGCTTGEVGRTWSATAGIADFLPAVEVEPGDLLVIGDGSPSCTPDRRVRRVVESGATRNLGLGDGDLVVLGGRGRNAPSDGPTIFVRVPDIRSDEVAVVEPQLVALPRELLGTFLTLRGGDASALDAQRVDDVDQFASAQRGARVIAAVFGLASLGLSALATAAVYSSGIRARMGVLGLMRVAGAPRSFLFALVIVEVVVLTVFGAVVGLVAAKLIDGSVGQFLDASFGQRTSIVDSVAMARGVAVTFVAGMLAGFIPAVRAASVDVVRAVEP